MTVLEVIQRSSEYLAGKGVEAPRLQIELLLAKVLHLPRLQLYLNFQRPLSEAELGLAREYVRRRGQREPLQHILGSTSFCGLEMEVTPQVMVPRPETELLAERAWSCLHARANEPGEVPMVLDWGTGSGCLAIAVAVKCPSASVHAIDVSAGALAVARRNAKAHQTGDRVSFWESDGFKALPPELVFDLIVANPPYIPRGVIPTLDPEVKDYDPLIALDGGPDGLDFYRRLAVEAAERMRPAGKLMVELGDGQDGPSSQLFRDRGWCVEGVYPDLSGQPRILVAGRPNP